MLRRAALVGGVLVADEETDQKALHELLLLHHLEDALDGGCQAQHYQGGDKKEGEEATARVMVVVVVMMTMTDNHPQEEGHARAAEGDGDDDDNSISGESGYFHLKFDLTRSFQSSLHCGLLYWPHIGSC